MNEKIKNYLGVALIVASLAFAYGSVGFVLNQPNFSERTFSVEAEGKVVAIPDIGNFSFSVITEGGTNLDSLQTQNSEITKRTNDFLKEQGVDEDDIETTAYNVFPRRQHHECDEFGVCLPSEIVGYSINQTVSVKVRDLDSAGALLSGVINNGANSVSNLSFSVDDEDTLRAKAQGKAVQAAEDKAQIVAHEGDFRLGKIVSVSTLDSPIAVPFRSLAFDESVGGSVDVPVEPGSEEIVVRVIVTYEIN